MEERKIYRKIVGYILRVSTLGRRMARTMISEKRNVIVAPFPRTMNEIFCERDLKRLASFANVLWAEDRELPDAVLENLLPETWAFVAFSPPMTTERLRLSSQLKAILEVGGLAKTISRLLERPDLRTQPYFTRSGFG